MTLKANALSPFPRCSKALFPILNSTRNMIIQISKSHLFPNLGARDGLGNRAKADPGQG